MATYSETFNGGAVGSGCSIIEQQFNFESTFNIGDIAYIEGSARKGKLEKICIKKILMDINTVSVSPKYIDTLNGLYFSNELINYSEAVALARAYHREKIIKLKEKLDELC